MKRRLLNALAVLSLILSLATGVLWVRSYWVKDFLGNRSVKGSIYAFGSIRGQLSFVLVRGEVGSPIVRGWEWETTPAEQSTKSNASLFDYFKWLDETDRSIFIIFPHWSLLALCLILPSLRAWQLLRARKRRQENLCPTCGYDLRVTPDRCPECGHTARAPAPAQATTASSRSL